MNPNLEEDIKSLPKDKKIKFKEELHAILNDIQYSLLYGIPLKDYSHPSNEEIELVKQKLYNEMFGQTA